MRGKALLKCEGVFYLVTNYISPYIGSSSLSERGQAKYTFTDPESRILKNSTHQGYDQHSNVQAAFDQGSLLIVAHTLSNHPNDKQEAAPNLDALSPRIGKPDAAALDHGYFSQANIAVNAVLDLLSETSERNQSSFSNHLNEGSKTNQCQSLSKS